MEFPGEEGEEHRRKEEALKDFKNQVREAVFAVLEMKKSEIRRAPL